MCIICLNKVWEVFLVGAREVKAAVSVALNVAFVPYAGAIVSVFDYLVDSVVSNSKSIKDKEREHFYGPLNSLLSLWSFRAEKVLDGVPVYEDALHYFDDQVSESMIDYINLLEDEVIPFIESHKGYLSDKKMLSSFEYYIKYWRDTFGYEPDDLTENLGNSENQELFVRSGVLFSVLINKIVMKEKLEVKDIRDANLLEFGEYEYPEDED